MSAILKMPRLLVFIVAYQAEATIEKVVRRIPVSLADDFDVEILAIDDGSKDRTFAVGLNVSRTDWVPFKLTVLYNPVNQGYGGNQKIGYHYAIENGFDYVALLHGDEQYAPELLPTLVRLLRDSPADAVFGSRMLASKDALRGGMPLYKYYGNRILTACQNRLLGTKLSEFHSGYRVYSARALRQIPFERNSNDFHFDTEIIIQLLFAQQRIIEHPIPTYYGDEICRVSGMKYAANVMRASLQAYLQRFYLYYDRRFDCAPVQSGRRYPSKLEFDSTHSHVYELVPEGSRVLDLGSGTGALGAALRERKNCSVTGVDVERSDMAARFDRFIVADLNAGIPDVGDKPFDYVLVLDVVEHLAAPEDFLDQLRQIAAPWPNARLVFTTGNVGFVVMRLLLVFGRFEYGLRGILDLTHTRLFTFATFRRALRSSGFAIERSEGVVPPLPFIFGSSRLGRVLMTIAKAFVRLRPTLFGFQCLIVARPNPTLHSLLARAHAAALEKEAALRGAAAVPAGSDLPPRQHSERIG
jgi:glycosyltransferase involved in cell wall biosynthesis